MHIPYHSGCHTTLSCQRIQGLGKVFKLPRFIFPLVNPRQCYESSSHQYFITKIFKHTEKLKKLYSEHLCI